MENFVFENPTKIIFGRETHKQVGREVKKISDRVLLHYGMGSIKKSGLYDQVMESLKQADVKVYELGGVQPNPRLSLTIEGARICRKNGIGSILAVGGGSVIDSAKAIALNACYEGESMWDFVTKKAKPTSALPVGVVLTIPAAGSESSDVAVITNDEGMQKWGYHNELIYPEFAIINPELTFTLPLNQLASGAADIMAHVMERYFTRVKNVELTDRLCEAVMKTVVNNAPLALKDPRDYNPRAELMWASTIAHNNLLNTGRMGDWGTHKLAHELSTYNGVPHGAALAILFPAWMKYVYKEDMDIFSQFASRVFDVNPESKDKESIVLEGIEKLSYFSKSLGLPTHLRDIDVDKEAIEDMAEKTQLFGPIGRFVELDKQDVVKIFELAI
jgi:alcohol dehydrogenase YqhD (iron-dependent ADH family)